MMQRRSLKNQPLTLQNHEREMAVGCLSFHPVNPCCIAVDCKLAGEVMFVPPKFRSVYVLCQFHKTFSRDLVHPVMF